MQDGSAPARSGNTSPVAMQATGMAFGHTSRPDRVAAGPEADLSRAPDGSRCSVVRVARVFAGLPDQIAVARDFVRRVLGPVPVADDAALLVSELCTNALLHTAAGRSGTFVVIVLPRPGSVRVEVRDGGSGQPPTPHPIDALAEDGRGLSLVDLIADRWGYSGDCQGRSVFFELTWADVL